MVEMHEDDGILVVTNSHLAPRPLCICMRSYDEFTRLASVLRPYINMRDLPTKVPRMKRNQKKESMKAFLRWCGSFNEILSLIVIQSFIYSITPIEDIIAYCKVAPSWSTKRSRSSRTKLLLNK